MSIEIRRAVAADAETVLTMLGELAAYQDQQQYVTASPQDWQGSAEAYESQLNE
jgi:hypothetical protein